MARTRPQQPETAFAYGERDSRRRKHLLAPSGVCAHGRRDEVAGLQMGRRASDRGPPRAHGGEHTDAPHASAFVEDMGLPERLQAARRDFRRGQCGALRRVCELPAAFAGVNEACAEALEDLEKHPKSVKTCLDIRPFLAIGRHRSDRIDKALEALKWFQPR